MNCDIGILFLILICVIGLCSLIYKISDFGHKNEVNYDEEIKKLEQEDTHTTE